MSPTKRRLNKRDRGDLLDRVNAEVRASSEWVLPVHMDLQVLMSLMGAVHLAMRHPGYTGPSRHIVEQLADGIIARLKSEGFEATAELMELGADPAYDV